MLSGKQLVLPGYESTQTDFLREDDLALLLCRMFDDPWEEPYLDSNVSGKNKISFEELAKLYTELGREHGVQVEVKYSGKDECTPLYQTDEWARREYGWAPMADIRRDLEEASHSQLERNNKNKNRRAHSILSRRIFRIVVEQIVLFAVAEALNYLTRDNGMFNFIDFRFVYITIIACINGLGAGAVSALMAGVGYIFSNAAQMSWQVLFFNVQNWLPFACYLLIGCVLGYNRDKACDDIKSKADELKLLEEKYDFLQGLYTEVAKGKERFNNQIIGYKDSFGKMYSVVKRLNSTLPEMVFYEAVDVCERLDAETKSKCQERKESTYAECERVKRETREETDNLRAETESACQSLNDHTEETCANMRAEATAECEEMRNQARTEAYNTRMSVKRECESVSEYMAQMKAALDNVVISVDNTIKVADQAFPEISNN